MSNVNYQGASWDLPAQTTVKEFVQFFWGTDNSNTTDTANLQAANPGSQYQGNYITKYSLNPLDRSQSYETPFTGSGPTATSNPNYNGPNINVIT